MQSTLNDPNSENVWRQLAPLLEEVMARLSEKERTLVALRFFENKSAAETAALLGIREWAAHKRAARAMEKLRQFFVKRGIASTTATLAGAISANSVQAAPAMLAKAVTATAIAKGATASASTLTLIKGALKIMAWSKMKTTTVTAAIIICAAGVGTGIYIYPAARGPAAELQAALYVEKPSTGNWQYPTVKVMDAIFDFGSKRADAFPILERAVRGSNSEARKQALAAMGMIASPAMTKSNIASILLAYPKINPLMLTSLQSEPATNAVPVLREILFANNDLSSFALSSLDGLLEAKDIPALADLLVKSHHTEALQKAIAKAPVAQAQSLLAGANDIEQLQRYLPETIAEIISRNPDTAAPFISSVEDLLDDANADVRFGAACALAKYKGVNDPKISTELTAGLESRYDSSRLYLGTENLKQLMAIEKLQDIGPDAKPMIPALLEYAKSIDDKLMRELAFRAVGHIDSSLRNTMPEVDQALKNDPSAKR